VLKSLTVRCAGGLARCTRYYDEEVTFGPMTCAPAVCQRRAGLEEAEPGGGQRRAAARSAARLDLVRANSAVDGLGVGARCRRGW
jgi:hypothetical protein